MEGVPCDIIYTGLASHALAGLDGIKPDEYRRRKKLLMTLPCEELAAFVGCDIYLRPKYDFVAAIGPVAGLRLVRKIVHECIVHNVPPAPRIKNFKTYLQAKRGLSKLRLA